MISGKKYKKLALEISPLTNFPTDCSSTLVLQPSCCIALSCHFYVKNTNTHEKVMSQVLEGLAVDTITDEYFLTEDRASGAPLMGGTIDELWAAEPVRSGRDQWLLSNLCPRWSHPVCSVPCRPSYLRARLGPLLCGGHLPGLFLLG